ncbi:helix-turn-helix transcriptional regulator [Aerococcaceae bacterium zg-ZJ1578]|uniref:helix-turn-helix transcriptional regulator n=1 Tax=Aerococcaceae bacterium zg-252 TaxID=2796928 RepID=UPI001A2A3D7F|nr:helix-turn-helix transcriptional regulator [Aerococcaceae bacterium zg-1578]MBR7928411.1 helix-turn-helix transcriptional regulator [Aerococcaceae bacterium zg-ZUI334]MBS4461199.1 helix-turn-helix transcriptional regulator [Aerococcaceae bacterium zg-B36]
MEKIVKDLLQEKGKSQTWLANEMGITRQHLYLMLKQKDITLKTAFKLADVLNIDVNVFRERE